MHPKYFVLPLSYSYKVKTYTYTNKVKLKNCFRAIKIHFSDNKQISYCSIEKKIRKSNNLRVRKFRRRKK